MLALHFDPLGLNSGNDWSRGNFDGDADVDISDFAQLVRNFSPLGYAIQSALEAHSTTAVISAAVVAAAGPASGSGDATALVARADASAILRTDLVDRAFADGDAADDDMMLFFEDFSRRRLRLHHPNEFETTSEGA